jgi:hypothetical protein
VNGRPKARPRRNFFLTVDTQLWDDDVLWELPVKERKRVKNAMTWGRPLPPRLARVAVEHAPMLAAQAWYGYWMITLGLVFGLIAALFVWAIGWMGAATAVTAMLWLLLGAGWLRAVAQARRAARTGQWPVRPE